MRHLKLISVSLLIGLVLVIVNQPVMAQEGKININSASQQELVTLKHVGEKLAQRIIDFRKAHPFEHVEDIMKVKGVGQKIYKANKNKITVREERKRTK